MSVTLQAARLRPDKPASGCVEYLVLGTVVAVKADRSMITIRESDLLGHLRIRFKSYQVKQPFLLYGLRPGDKISAVFSANDSMLHRLRRVQSYRAFMPEPFSLIASPCRTSNNTARRLSKETLRREPAILLSMPAEW
jgi:hypothetical protein